MTGYFNIIFHYRWQTILAALALFAVAFLGAFDSYKWAIPFKTDYKVFFQDDNKQLQDYLSLQRIYSKSDNISIIVAPKNGNIFTAQSLSAIRELTDEAWTIEYGFRVDSIANFQHSYAEEDNLIIEDLITKSDLFDSNSIARIKAISLSEPLTVKNLVSQNSDAAVVNVTIRLPDEDLTAAVPKVAESARQIRDQFTQRYPEIDFMLSGVVMMNTSFQEIAQLDSATRIPAMLFVVLLMVGILLRTVSGTMATLLVITLSVGATMGIWGWLGGYLTGPSTTAPIVILTLAVADCVHILSNFYQNMRRGMDKASALKDSLKVNMQPVFLTTLTTAIGFLTMNFSDAPPFVHLGNMVAIGVVLAFLFSVTLFPAMLMLLPVKVKPERENKANPMDKFASFVLGNRRWLLPVSSVVIITLTAFVPSNELNDDLVKYFDQSVPFRQAADFQQDHISGMTTLELSIDSTKSNGINDPGFIRFVADLSDWLRSLDKVDHVNTITDTLKRLNRNMHADDPIWYKLPDETELIAQYFLLYELSLPAGLDINNQINVDKSSTRVIVTFENLTTNEILAFEQKISDYFKQQNSGYTLSIASPSLMFAHIGSSNIVSMLKGSSIALVLISVLLVFALRSLKFGLISLLTNLAPVAVAFGVWGAFVGEVGLGLSVVMGVSIGIIVDDTVHFLSKYIRARREKGLSPEDAVRYSFASVGRALLVTSMVLVVGFCVMATSSLKVNADMGTLTAVTIFIALIIDFLFLPPLLVLLAGRQEKQIERHAVSENIENGPTSQYLLHKRLGVQE